MNSKASVYAELQKMAYINRYSKDYFTWSDCQAPTCWARNAEEVGHDEKLLGIPAERARDACLESAVQHSLARKRLQRLIRRLRANQSIVTKYPLNGTDSSVVARVRLVKESLLFDRLRYAGSTRSRLANAGNSAEFRARQRLRCRLEGIGNVSSAGWRIANVPDSGVRDGKSLGAYYPR